MRLPQPPRGLPDAAARSAARSEDEVFEGRCSPLSQRSLRVTLTLLLCSCFVAGLRRSRYVLGGATVAVAAICLVVFIAGQVVHVALVVTRSLSIHPPSAGVLLLEPARRQAIRTPVRPGRALLPWSETCTSVHSEPRHSCPDHVRAPAPPIGAHCKFSFRLPGCRQRKTADDTVCFLAANTRTRMATPDPMARTCAGRGGG